MANFDRPVSEALSILESATFTQTQDRAVSEALSLVEANIVHKGFYENVSEALSLTERVGRIYDQTVSESLSLVETAGKLPLNTVSETITLSEDVTFTVSSGLSESLVLVESATRSGTFSRATTESLNLREDVLFDVKGQTCVETYTPSPTLGIAGNTVLSFPYISPTITVTLRNPKFGNVQRQDTSRILRQTRGGEQITAREDTWILFTYLQFDFEALSKAVAVELISLLEASAGDEIKLVDHENRTWRGQIVSDPNDIVENFDDDCQYSASFQFEGVLQ